MKFRIVTARASLGAILLTLAACASDEPEGPSEEVLSTTVRVKVANTVFMVPVAEIQSIWQPSNERSNRYLPQDIDIGKTEAERLARDARQIEPIGAATLDISRLPYSILVDCTRKASLFCRARRESVDADLPARFSVIDTRYLKDFGGVTSTGQPLSEDLVAASRLPRQPVVGCGTTGYCRALTRLSPGLIIFWDSYPKSETRETPQAIAQRQSRALLRVFKGS